MKPLYPIYNQFTKDSFLVKPGLPRVQTIGDMNYITGYLKTDLVVDLLGISQTPHLLETGYYDKKDFLDPSIAIKSVAYTVNGESRKIDFTGDTFAKAFYLPGDNSYRTMKISWQDENVKFVGDINLETGFIYFTATAIDDQVITDSGYVLTAFRSNNNINNLNDVF